MELDLNSIADLVEIQDKEKTEIIEGVKNEEKIDDEQPKEIKAEKKIDEDYVDPLNEEYVINANNKFGGKVWKKEGDGKILNDLWLVEKQRNINW